MTSNQCPAKAEIQQIFKRLRSVQANKICFDCGAKNPTWASVTYGIFICIDCSGIHRSLGVHLTFVRSTQLDSNWTWQQVRQMQLGGNSNATSFFRQHNCVTNDAQQKYKSRAAQLYRDKLHHQAAQAMRLHGTKVFIDSAHNTPSVGDDDKDANGGGNSDFFESHSNQANNGDAEVFAASSETSSVSLRQQPQEPQQKAKSAATSGAIPIKDADNGEGPNVEAALSMSPTAAAEQLKKEPPRKSTIGARKPAAKKGLGAKKAGGLGAQKVKKDFAEIEKEAELADQTRSKMEEERREAAKKTAEDEEKAVASMRLAYQDLSVQQKKTEEKLRHVDPKKAKQVERLGMGAAKGSAAVSHSALTEMSTIEQEEPRGGFGGGRSGGFGSSSRGGGGGRRAFDDDDFGGGGGGGGAFGGFRDDGFDRDPYGSRGGGGGFGKSDLDRSDDWEKEFEVLKSTKPSTSSGGGFGGGGGSEWNNNFDDKPRRGADFGSRPPMDSGPSGGGADAQKKFGGAKAISSDMFFSGSDANEGKESEAKKASPFKSDDEANGGPDANATRFSNASSISSAEYFNRQETTPGMAAGYGGNLNAPDMDEVKESVRQGVNKVAGRLSNMASGVMNQLQDRYGY